MPRFRVEDSRVDRSAGGGGRCFCLGVGPLCAAAIGSWEGDVPRPRFTARYLGYHARVRPKESSASL